MKDREAAGESERGSLPWLLDAVRRRVSDGHHDDAILLLADAVEKLAFTAPSPPEPQPSGRACSCSERHPTAGGHMVDCPVMAAQMFGEPFVVNVVPQSSEAERCDD